MSNLSLFSCIEISLYALHNVQWLHSNHHLSTAFNYQEDRLHWQLDILPHYFVLWTAESFTPLLHVLLECMHVFRWLFVESMFFHFFSATFPFHFKNLFECCICNYSLEWGHRGTKAPEGNLIIISIGAEVNNTTN